MTRRALCLQSTVLHYLRQVFVPFRPESLLVPKGLLVWSLRCQEQAATALHHLVDVDVETVDRAWEMLLTRSNEPWPDITDSDRLGFMSQLAMHLHLHHPEQPGLDPADATWTWMPYTALQTGLKTRLPRSLHGAQKRLPVSPWQRALPEVPPPAVITWNQTRYVHGVHSPPTAEVARRGRSLHVAVMRELTSVIQLTGIPLYVLLPREMVAWTLRRRKPRAILEHEVTCAAWDLCVRSSDPRDPAFSRHERNTVLSQLSVSLRCIHPRAERLDPPACSTHTWMPYTAFQRMTLVACEHPDGDMVKMPVPYLSACHQGHERQWLIEQQRVRVVELISADKADILRRDHRVESLLQAGLTRLTSAIADADTELRDEYVRERQILIRDMDERRKVMGYQQQCLRESVEQLEQELCELDERARAPEPMAMETRWMGQDEEEIVATDVE